MLFDGYYEWYESAFKPWEGREEELKKIEDAFMRDLQMAQIGEIGNARKMAAD